MYICNCFIFAAVLFVALIIYIVANCSLSSDSDVKTMPTNATTKSYVNEASHINSTSSNKSCNLYWLLFLLLLIPLAYSSCYCLFCFLHFASTKKERGRNSTHPTKSRIDSVTRKYLQSLTTNKPNSND